MLPSTSRVAAKALGRSANLASTAPKALGAAPMQVHGKVSPGRRHGAQLLQNLHRMAPQGVLRLALCRRGSDLRLLLVCQCGRHPSAHTHGANRSGHAERLQRREGDHIRCIRFHWSLPHQHAWYAQRLIAPRPPQLPDVARLCTHLQVTRAQRASFRTVAMIWSGAT